MKQKIFQTLFPKEADELEAAKIALHESINKVTLLECEQQELAGKYKQQSLQLGQILGLDQKTANLPPLESLNTEQELLQTIQNVTSVNEMLYKHIDTNNTLISKLQTKIELIRLSLEHQGYIRIKTTSYTYPFAYGGGALPNQKQFGDSKISMKSLNDITQLGERYNHSNILDIDNGYGNGIRYEILK